MLLFTRRLWSSIACPRTLLGTRRNRPLSLMAILAAIMLLCDCHSGKNLTTVEKVQDQASNPRFVQQDFSFSYPLWQNERNEWTTSATVRDTVVPPDAIFAVGQQSSLDDLWKVGLTTTYRHLLEKGWIDGVSVNVESVGEKPFNSFSEMTEGVRVFLKVPQGQHDFWLLSLSYSSTNGWSLPVPKVEYTWQPSARLQGNIGLGLPVTDHPLDYLSLDVSIKLLSPLQP